MATITLTANTNWSAISPQPINGDTVDAGNYVCTFDVDVNQPNTLLTSNGGYFLAEHASGTRTVAARADNGTHNAYGLIRNESSGVLIFTGAVKGGNGSYARGANNNGSGTLYVTTATGGNGNSSRGANNDSSGTLYVTTATGGNGDGSHGANNNGSGTLRCDLAIGSAWGVGGNGAYTHGVYGSGSAGQITTVKRTRSGQFGCPAIGGAVFIKADASNSCQMRTVPNGGTVTMADAAADADFPATSDVRAGVVYDNGDLIGTLVVPSAANVALGVAVDATVGTAVLTASAVRNAIGVGAANIDTQLAGITAGVANIEVDYAAIASAVVSAFNAATPAPAVNVTHWKNATAPTLPDDLATTAALTAAVAPLATEDTVEAIRDKTDALPADPASQSVLETAIGALGEDSASVNVATWGGVPVGVVPTVVNTNSAVNGSTITVQRGDTVTLQLRGAGNVETTTALYFTVKSSLTESDDSALIQASQADGLLRLLGNDAIQNATWFNMTVLNATAGDLDIVLHAALTSQLTVGSYHYDVQAHTGEVVNTRMRGMLIVPADVTRRIA